MLRQRSEGQQPPPSSLSSESESLVNGEQEQQRRRQKPQQGGAGLGLGILSLCLSVLAIGAVIGCIIWHSKWIADNDARQKQVASDLSAAIQYQQAQIDMLHMSTSDQNSTFLETGVCTVYSTTIDAFANVENMVSTGILISYSVYSRDFIVYTVFQNFSVPISMPSSPSGPSFGACPNPDNIQHFSIFTFGTCTQDLTGATPTPSLMNEIVGHAPDSKIILPPEQAKFQIDNNSILAFTAAREYDQPFPCVRNQYSVIEMDFGGDFVNGYLFKIGLVNASTTIRLTAPVMLLLGGTAAIK